MGEKFLLFNIVILVLWFIFYPYFFSKQVGKIANKHFKFINEEVAKALKGGE